jgi:hypothetical protein
MNRIGKLRTTRPGAAAQRVSRKTWTLVPLLAALLGSGAAHAQAAVSPSPTPQFDILGFIQAATLETVVASNTTCPVAANPTIKDPLQLGGTLTVNNTKIIVPCNTILQMPARPLSWAQVFDARWNAPFPAGAVRLNGKATMPAGQSGLAIADLQADFTIPGAGGALISTPFPSFEVHVIGNILKDAAGNDQYIAGLILPISQQSLNAQFGKITCIDYTTGTLYVGGANLATPTTACAAVNGARVILNDAKGRYGIAHSPDARFTADENNTTVHSATGYPMCIPRTNPATADDALCPRGNRPLNGDPRFNTTQGAPPGPTNTGPVGPDRFLAIGAPLRIFTMPPPPGKPGADPSGFPDATKLMPFVVGDYITYSGTLAKDATGTTQNLTGQYISANTVIANVGVFTTPGVSPAYVSIESLLLGTAGPAEDGIIAETTTRIFVTGFTTDPSAPVDLFAADVNPCTGVQTNRPLGTLDPASQPTQGRWRFHVLGGTFMPPTREMIAISHTGTSFGTTSTNANGLGFGFYQAPNFLFIFPENVRLGEPIISNNFQEMPFLAQGSGPLDTTLPTPTAVTTSSTTFVMGQLAPWPGLTAPAKANCAAGGIGPTVSAGTDFAVGPSRPEQLNGTFTQDPSGLAGPATAVFTQTAGPAVVLTGATTITSVFGTQTVAPSFTTPAVAAGGSVNLQFKLTVTDAFGTTSSLVNVTVLGTIDVLSAGEAVFRFPTTAGQGTVLENPPIVPKQIHKVGDKGGRLTVGATSSSTSFNLSMQVVGYGFMQVDPVAGIPVYTLSVSGEGLAAPASVLVRSSLGGELLITPVVLK